MSARAARGLAVLLVCGSIICALSLGIRHTFGLFMRPMTMDLQWGREAFAFAIALQNLVWGAAQPFSGWLADRFGAGRVIVGGGLLYALGLLVMAVSTQPASFALGAGVLVGLGLSGTTFSVVYGAVARAVREDQRAKALALVGAGGSFGQFVLIPASQSLIEQAGWLETLLVLAFASALIAPFAAGAAERIRPARNAGPDQTALEALREAFAQRSFWLLTVGFFVCGFQVVFVAAHLPAYVIDRGLSSNVGMMALALIGLFNIFGSLGFGTAAGYLSKRYLLAGIYFSRSAAIAIFLLLPITPLSVAVFGALMGLLWLSTVPLTNGLVGQIFGVRYLAMLSGFVFLSHQIGSFLGAWIGGILFDRTGSYALAWILCIALGVLAGLINLPVDERPLSAGVMAPAH